MDHINSDADRTRSDSPSDTHGAAAVAMSLGGPLLVLPCRTLSTAGLYRSAAILHARDSSARLATTADGASTWATANRSGRAKDLALKVQNFVSLVTKRCHIKKTLEFVEDLMETHISFQIW